MPTNLRALPIHFAAPVTRFSQLNSYTEWCPVSSVRLVSEMLMRVGVVAVLLAPSSHYFLAV